MTTDQPTPTEESESIDSPRQQLRAAIPDNAHVTGQFMGPWIATWTTPAGIWRMTHEQGLIGSATVKITGPDVKITQTGRGVAAVLELLRALGAIA